MLCRSEEFLHIGRWEGFPHDRRDLLEFIQRNNITGVIFATTDVHFNYMGTSICRLDTNGLLLTTTHVQSPDEIYVDVYNKSNSTVPVAYEVIVGPIATDSPVRLVKSYMDDAGVPESVQGPAASLFRRFINGVFSAVNKPYCHHLDKYAYGTLNYTVINSSLTVSIKGDDGTVISDESNDNRLCEFTVQHRDFGKVLPDFDSASSPLFVVSQRFIACLVCFVTVTLIAADMAP